MPALWLWWNLLPVPLRRLIGAVLILGTSVGCIALAVHHERNVGFDKGYWQAYDSMQTVKTKRLIAQHSRDSAVADSAVREAVKQTSALALVRDSLDAKLRVRPTGLRIEPLPDSFAHVPTADKVRVIVASTGDTVDDVPRQAALYWFRTDSLLGIAKTLLDKYAAANRQWADAWQDEHAARIGADSLTAMYAERLRSQTVPVAAKQHRLVYATIGAVVALVARNQIHHR